MRDRLPPFDTQAEQAALGCMLLNPVGAIPAFQEALPMGPEVFYDLRHQTIYGALLDIHSQSGAVDIVTLQSALKGKQTLEQVGGVEYLATLPEATPSAANLPYYADILRTHFIRRRILAVCVEHAGKVYDSSDTVETDLDELEKAVMAIRQAKPKAGQTIRELVRESINSIEEMHQRQGKISGIPTGLTDLDKLSGGLQPGEVTIIAGYPGAGKTSLAMNIVEHAMLYEKKKVAVFSLEMSAVSLVTRFICSHARVNLKSMSRGFLTERDFQKLAGTAGAISKAAVYFEDDSDLSIFQLRAKARRLMQQHGIELIVIDYLQLLSAVGGSRQVESRQQEVSDISKNVKAMARELRVPVIALSQLNDDGKLRESRAIGQDADNVWVLKPEDEDENNGADSIAVDLEIKKARNGPRGKVHLTFLRCYTRFESAAKIEREDVQRASVPYKDE